MWRSGDVSMSHTDIGTSPPRHIETSHRYITTSPHAISHHQPYFFN
jgi:hypothetical protein